MDWFGILLFGIVGVLILTSIRSIPSDPPHKGLGTYLGKRTDEVYDEGYHFIFGYPWLYGFILVKMEEVPFTVTLPSARTPDRADSKIPMHITFKPDPERLIEYQNSGGEMGVKTQLSGKVIERMREWAAGPEEGPATWVELNQSHLEAVSVLLKQIAGNYVSKIPDYAQPVPTWIWLRYYTNPRPKKHNKNEKAWAKSNWAKVRAVLQDIVDNHGPAAETALQVAVADRRREIQEIRNGEGKIFLRDLGIILQRLNLGNVDVLGGVAEAAETQAIEEQEYRGEELELRFVRERIKELMEEPFKYTREQARDIVQTERKKVVRTINDQHISLDPSTAEIAAGIIGGIAGRKP